MDFDELVRDGMITVSTREWMEPFWRLDEEQTKEAREARTSYNIFFLPNDHDDEEDSSDGFMEEDSSTINIHGTTIPFRIEDTSTGHGNRVWAASVATCFYIFDHFYERKDLLNSTPTFHSIELGAGTALPSLYLAHLLATGDDFSNNNNDDDNNNKPSVHITDAKQYRNILQILTSVLLQPDLVRRRVQFHVFPHDWGTRIDVRNGDDETSFPLLDEGPLQANTITNVYDLVLVSDCIYDSNYHDALLKSISNTLALPTHRGIPGMMTGHDSQGGRALVSFSLHGNIDDDAVWKFLELAETTRSPDGHWRLRYAPVSSLSSGSSSDTSPKIGWNMEESMKELGIWVAHLEPSRWIAYLYELRWVPGE